MAGLDLPWDGPADGSCVLKRATVPACLMEAGAGRDGLVQVDIVVDRGRIASLSLHDPASPGIDLDCRMVWPCPVDLHAHLDKGHIWPRAANPDGTFMGALAAVERDRRGTDGRDRISRDGGSKTHRSTTATCTNHYDRNDERQPSPRAIRLPMKEGASVPVIVASCPHRSPLVR